MQTQDPQTQEKLLARLRRIEGQVRGVQNMISDGRDCREILQQLTAIRSAVQSASLSVVQTYATECLLNLDEGDRAGRQAFVLELVDILGKTP